MLPSFTQRVCTLIGGVALACAALSTSSAWAQFKLGASSQVTPRMQTNQELDTRAADGAVRKTTADYIVAVINQEVLTRTDVDRRVARIMAQSQGQGVPPMEELRQQVLDLLIDEKVQVAQAKVLGMDIADAEVDGTIESIAAQNKMTVAQMRARMQSEGMDFIKPD